MNNLLKNLLSFFKLLLVPICVFAIVLGFFWKIFLGYIPLPGDFIVGVYYPWLDYKWGFPAGVPVKNPIMADVVSFTYPMQTYAISLLKNGQPPLWNPYILAGTPLLANFQSAPFAITNFVYIFFNTINGWTAKIILQHVLAIFFTYLLLKHWKVSKWGSLVGGIIYAFAGFNLIWSQWNAHTLVASFIPLLILLTDKWFIQPKIRYGVLISIVLGLQILSGYPQLVIYTFFALALLWLFYFKFSFSFLIETFIYSLFIFLGFGVASIQLLPARELLSISQRSVEPHPFEWAFLPWRKVITFFASDYFGNHTTGNYWGPQDYTSNTGFVGVVSSSLATLGFRKNKTIWYLVSLFILSLMLSFPTSLSIFIWKSGFLGLQAASAHRALVLMNLSVALLAGFGFDRIQKSKSFISVFVPSFFIVSFAISTFVIWFLNKSNEAYLLAGPIHWVSVGLRNLAIPFVTCVILFLVLLLARIKKGAFFAKTSITALLIFELFHFGWKFTPMTPKEFVYPETPVISFLKSQKQPFRVTGSTVIPINMRMPLGLESLEGYDAIYPLQISKFIADLNKGGDNANPLGRYAIVDNDISQLLALTNTKFVLALKEDIKDSPSENGNVSSKYEALRYTKAFSDKTTEVLEDTTVRERAFVSFDWKVIPNENELLDRLFALGNYETVFLEKDPHIVQSSEGKTKVTYVDYQPQSSVLSVETDKAGLLFISDDYYPGWKATVDGVGTEILKADYTFRAIPVSAGKHTIHMWYAPESYNLGVKITFASLLICGVLLILLPLFSQLKYTFFK